MKQFLDFGECPPLAVRSGAGWLRHGHGLPPRCCLWLGNAVRLGRRRLRFPPGDASPAGSFPGGRNCGEAGIQLKTPAFGVRKAAGHAPRPPAGRVRAGRCVRDGSGAGSGARAVLRAGRLASARGRSLSGYSASGAALKPQRSQRGAPGFGRLLGDDGEPSGCSVALQGRGCAGKGPANDAREPFQSLGMQPCYETFRFRTPGNVVCINVYINVVCNHLTS